MRFCHAKRVGGWGRSVGGRVLADAGIIFCSTSTVQMVSNRGILGIIGDE